MGEQTVAHEEGGGPQGGGGDQGGPAVEVIDLNTNRKKKFHAQWTDTLQQVWERAYRELGESRRERDRFECQEGRSLMDLLNLTLAELRERKICQDRKFQITGETGGA